MRPMCPGIAIDLGSVRTRAWLLGRGAILDIPTVSFTGGGLNRPVQRGHIVDTGACGRMLERFLAHRTPRWGRRPLVLITTPVLSGDADRRALHTVLASLRPRNVLTIDTVKAGALGVGADLSTPLLVVDVGAHLTEVAVLTNGSVAHARRAPTGITDLYDGAKPDELVETIADLVTDLFRHGDSEHTVDALERGILLVGGGALWPQLAPALARRLCAPVAPAPAPHTSAIRGAALALRSARRHPTLTPDGPQVY